MLRSFQAGSIPGRSLACVVSLPGLWLATNPGLMMTTPQAWTYWFRPISFDLNHTKRNLHAHPAGSLFFFKFLSTTDDLLLTFCCVAMFLFQVFIHYLEQHGDMCTHALRACGQLTTGLCSSTPLPNSNFGLI